MESFTSLPTQCLVCSGQWFPWATLSRSVVLGPTVSAAPGNLLEMLIPWLPARPAQSKTKRKGLSSLFSQVLKVSLMHLTYGLPTFNAYRSPGEPVNTRMADPNPGVSDPGGLG